MLSAAVLLSGAAGLMYQVAWTRRLISVTSATATAQAVVLAVFMAGLGLGAALAGPVAGRLRRPLLGYAAVEAGAALLALASFPLIAASDRVRTLAGGGALGLWAQVAAVALFLLLPTTLLGASLPLLIEQCERALGPAAAVRGRVVSRLYGINTLGAAAGCWAAGYVTVEHLGLTRTAWLGAALALLAALAASLLRPAGAGVAGDRALPEMPLEPRPLLVAALAGFVGLGAEVLWTRLLLLIVPTTVYALTQVLIAVLLGIVLGAALAGTVARRASAAPDPAAAIAEAVAVVAALAAVALSLVPLVAVRLADDSALQLALASGGSVTAAAAVLLVLVPPSALIAAVLPLLTVASRRRHGAEAFGALYAANTAGSVLGSLAAGFLLLPWLGLRGSGAVMALGALVLAALAMATPRTPRRALAVVALAAVAAGLLQLAHRVPEEIYERHLPAGTRVLAFHEGVSSHVMVTESADFRGLWINSNRVASSFAGHRAIAHLPALLTADVRASLGIALGTGQTFAAALMHGSTRLDCVEIDAGVIELSRRWFGEVNNHLFDDPRMTVHVDDGRAFLRASAESYDLIVLEPLQAWSAGTSNLYSREFYQEAARRMRPGASLGQWIPFYGQGPEETRSMVATALSVFPSGSLWLTANDAVLVLSAEPFAPSLAELGRRIDERGLGAELAHFPLAETTDLAAFLLLGPDGLAGWSAGAEILEDDRPFLEFRAAHWFSDVALEDNFRAILASARPHLDGLEDYLVGASAEELERVRAAREVRDAIVAVRLLPDGDFAAQLEVVQAVSAPAQQSVVWRWLQHTVVTRWRRAAAG